MNKSVDLRAEAEADIERAHNYLEEIRPGLGKQFVARVRQVLERIESMPEMYATVFQDVRAVRLRQFRYVVYYIVLTDSIDVLAVLHGSLDSSVWQARLQ